MNIPSRYEGIPHAITFDVVKDSGEESFETFAEAVANCDESGVIWLTICDDDGAVLWEEVIHNLI